MGINYNPQIVTDGLVLLLDAGNGRSYPGSGATWTDLTSNTNATLINSPTFVTGNLGSISLNGSDQNVDISSFDYTSFSLNIIVKPRSTQQQYAIIIDNNHTSFRNFDLQQDSTNTNFYTFGIATNTVTISISLGLLPADIWHYLTFTYTSNGPIKYYKNGVFVAASSAGGSPVYNSTFLRIGRWGGGTRNWNGNVAMFSAYNRALTDQEVSQNFNAVRGRYGI